MIKHVAIIGLGTMGPGMAARLARGGIAVTAHDIAPEAIERAAREGRLKLLYMAPERLAVAGTVALLKRAGASLLAVDEAHCVSQWGHDFRPDYLRIGELRAALGLQTVALTATADAETRAEIVRQLFGGRRPEVFLRGFDRPNIHLAFQPKDGPRRQIMDFAAARRGQSGIIYCATRAKTETLEAALNAAGIPALAYHGGMEAEARRADPLMGWSGSADTQVQVSLDFPSQAAAIRFRPSTMRASWTSSPMFPRQAAPSSNGWKASPCPGSTPSKPDGA